jgi:hypothetical protein
MMRSSLPCVLAVLGAATMTVRARASALPTGESLHPAVVLLDADGDRVIESGKPISTARTCAACHDTEYIERHSYHAALGVNERTGVGSVLGGRAWDYSAGGIGRWDPLTYRYLTPPGDSQLDSGVADWLRLFGWRHVGGGIAKRGFGEGLLRGRGQGVAGGNAIDPNECSSI